MTVDQATVTAYDRLYPEGTYYWRVQAIDAQNQRPHLVAGRQLHQVQPAGEPQLACGRGAVSGTTPFRWAAQAFAAAYKVEVYKNNDLTFSAANRVFTATVRTTSRTRRPIAAAGRQHAVPVAGAPASTQPATWGRGRHPQAFISTGVAPNLLAPKAAIWVPTEPGLFQWTEVPGAASYTLNTQLQGRHESSSRPWRPRTRRCALATGTYTWNVTALDGVGKPLGHERRRASSRSTPRAPIVKKVAPGDDASRSRPSRSTFSEKVKGISKKSIELY